MPKFLVDGWRGYKLIALLIIIALFSGILTFYQWQAGVMSFLFLSLLIQQLLKEKNAFEHEVEEYIRTLTYRVSKAGGEAVAHMPIGMLLYSNEKKIQWMNSFISSFFQENIVKKGIDEISNQLDQMVEDQQQEGNVQIGDSFFEVKIDYEERLIYFLDVTEREIVKKQYEDSQIVVAIIYLDNYDEVTQGMEDQVRSHLNSQVTSHLNRWANEHEFLLRRTSSDRFVAVLDIKTLQEIERTRFAIIDEVREQTGKAKVQITLSIGVGVGENSIREIGQLAESSLDLALGRGGDQVAIKQKNGKVRFYGGKSNAMEKRTRVRARVISHALRDFVLECDRVVVMGHKYPDMDAVGAAIGVLKIAETNGKDAYCVIDPGDINYDVKKLMEEIERHDDLWSQFITPEEAKDLVTSQTLLIVVDTHKPSLVIEPALLDKAERVIVLDHHRRGEEFIDEPVLVYMEPYASSTSELVTELLEYQPQKLKMDRLEATALLAGIIVDTKSFAVRTGSRTFDAASFLRSQGADTTLVQRLLKEDIDHYIRRAKLVETAEIYREGIAISVAEEGEFSSQVVIAQAADTLLTMKGVVASFVISKREDEVIGISARSLGDVNVQLIMERLNGGGHLTNAAAQLEVEHLSEAKEQLQQAIDDYLKKGD